MIRALFLDTSGWVAALLPGQDGHDRALETYRHALTQRERIVTTNLVIAESHALLLRYQGYARALMFYDSVASDPLHQVVYVDGELERAAVDEWMRPRRDQAYSLCDAVSFELMRREQVHRALTYDRHFAGAGFQVLRA